MCNQLIPPQKKEEIHESEVEAYIHLTLMQIPIMELILINFHIIFSCLRFHKRLKIQRNDLMIIFSRHSV